jgi:hypothetical protein
MDTLESFLSQAEQLATASDRSLATVSKWLFRDADTLAALRSGRASCRLDTFLRAQQRLRDRMARLEAARADSHEGAQ